MHEPDWIVVLKIPALKYVFGGQWNMDQILAGIWE